MLGLWDWPLEQPFWNLLSKYLPLAHGLLYSRSCCLWCKGFPEYILISPICLQVTASAIELFLLSIFWTSPCFRPTNWDRHFLVARFIFYSYSFFHFHWILVVKKDVHLSSPEPEIRSSSLKCTLNCHYSNGKSIKVIMIEKLKQVYWWICGLRQMSSWFLAREVNYKLKGDRCNRPAVNSRWINRIFKNRHLLV